MTTIKEREVKYEYHKFDSNRKCNNDCKGTCKQLIDHYNYSLKRDMEWFSNNFLKTSTLFDQSILRMTIRDEFQKNVLKFREVEFEYLSTEE